MKIFDLIKKIFGKKEKPDNGLPKLKILDERSGYHPKYIPKPPYKPGELLIDLKKQNLKKDFVFNHKTGLPKEK